MMAANFSGLHDFVSMGGYFAYVWPAYGITLVVLIAQVWRIKKQWRDFWTKYKS